MATVYCPKPSSFYPKPPAFGIVQWNASQRKLFDAMLGAESKPPRVTAIPFPYGTGKTLAALGWLKLNIDRITRTGAPPKVFYITPYKALCDQVVGVITDKVTDSSIPPAFAIHGDTADNDRALYQSSPSGCCVCTPESFVRLPEWEYSHPEPCLFVADEAHMLFDETRGWAVDICLRLIRKAMLDNEESAVLVASASLTPGSASGLLDHYFKGSPPPLHNMYYLDAQDIPVVDIGPRVVVTPAENVKRDVRVKYANYTKESPEEKKIVSMVKSVVGGGEQCLVFVGSKMFGYKLLEEFGRGAPSLNVAFHNADLTQKERAAIEQEFASKQVSCLIHTQTLNTGLDFDCCAGIVAQVKTRMGDVSTQDVRQAISRVGRHRPGIVYVMLPKSVSEQAYATKLKRPLVGALLGLTDVPKWIASHWLGWGFSLIPWEQLDDLTATMTGARSVLLPFWGNSGPRPLSRALLLHGLSEYTWASLRASVHSGLFAWGNVALRSQKHTDAGSAMMFSEKGRLTSFDHSVATPVAVCGLLGRVLGSVAEFSSTVAFALPCADVSPELSKYTLIPPGAGGSRVAHIAEAIYRCNFPSKDPAKKPTPAMKKIYQDARRFLGRCLRVVAATPELHPVVEKFLVASAAFLKLRDALSDYQLRRKVRISP